MVILALRRIIGSTAMNRIQCKSTFDNTVLVSSIYYQYQTGSYIEWWIWITI